MSFFMALLAKRGSPETGQSQSLNGDQSGSQRAFQRTARTPGMDTIKGLALIGTFIGVLTIFAMKFRGGSAPAAHRSGPGGWWAA